MEIEIEREKEREREREKERERERRERDAYFRKDPKSNGQKRNNFFLYLSDTRNI